MNEGLREGPGNSAESERPLLEVLVEDAVRRFKQGEAQLLIDATAAAIQNAGLPIDNMFSILTEQSEMSPADLAKSGIDFMQQEKGSEFKRLVCEHIVNATIKQLDDYELMCQVEEIRISYPNTPTNI